MMDASDACNYSCRVEADCLQSDITDCFAACFSSFRDEQGDFLPEPCFSARIAVEACVSELTCDEFGSMMSGEPNPCSEVVGERSDACE